MIAASYGTQADGTTVVILDGYSEIGAHVCTVQCSDLGHLICLRHLIRSRAVTILIFSAKTIFIHTCTTCFELPSYIRTMVGTKIHMIAWFKDPKGGPGSWGSWRGVLLESLKIRGTLGTTINMIPSPRGTQAPMWGSWRGPYFKEVLSASPKIIGVVGTTIST